MKTTLSVTQITANFASANLKAECIKIEGENIFCKALNNYFVVDGKSKVWIKPNMGNARAYFEYCNSWGIMKSKANFDGLLHLPYVYEKRRGTKKTVREIEVEKILIACGLKKVKTEKLNNPIEDLKRIGGTFYVQVYKMFIELKKDFTLTGEIVGNMLIVNRVKDGKITGTYKFCIANVSNNQIEDYRLQNIFFTLLNMPIVTVTETYRGNYEVEQVFEPIEHPKQILSNNMYVNTNGKLKVKNGNFSKRLKRCYSLAA